MWLFFAWISTFPAMRPKQGGCRGDCRGNGVLDLRGALHVTHHIYHLWWRKNYFHSTDFISIISCDVHNYTCSHARKFRPAPIIPMQKKKEYLCRSVGIGSFNADLLRLGCSLLGHDDRQDAVPQAGAHCILIDPGWKGESPLELAN